MRARLIQAKVLAFVAVVTGGLALLAAKPVAAGPFHGVVAQGPLELVDYLRMAGGGVGSLRVVIEWRYVERTRGEFDWTYTDRLASRAKQFGVRLLPTIESPGPPLVADPPTDRESRNNFARFLGKAAARYGRKGEFWEGGSDKFAIRSWQIMNEVNGTAYWGDTPDAGAYAKILKVASKAIRKEDPKAKIMLAGMFSRPGGEKAIESWNYLRQLYRERTKGFFDTVAIHPYSKTLDGVVRNIQKLRDVIRKRHDRKVKLRIDEFGWGSGGCPNYCAGREGQAQLLTDAFRLFERKRKQWDIEGVNWFSWQNNPTARCEFCPSSGLVTADRQPKPSWEAFQQAAASMAQPMSVHRVGPRK